MVFGGCIFCPRLRFLQARLQKSHPKTLRQRTKLRYGRRRQDLNIAIVDDLREDRDQLKNVLADYASAHALHFDFSVFTGGEELLENYRSLMYTIIFLDIYMDGMTGIEAAERIRAVDDETILVFLTTSEDQQGTAIHYHVYDYLLKPCDPAAIYNVMDHILRLHAGAEDKSFSFSWERINYNLKYADIVCVLSQGNNLSVLAKDGTQYKPRITFSSAKSVLTQDERFLEIMRGILVNMDYILDLTGSICYLKGGLQFPVNVRNSRKIIQIWQNFLFAQARGSLGGESNA